MASSYYAERSQRRNTGEGLWRRGIDELEQFYSTFCRSPQHPSHTAFPVTCHASFTVPKTEDGAGNDISNHLRDAFCKAWCALRVEDPMIGSWTELNPETRRWEKCYASFHDAKDPEWAQGQWVEETFRAVPMDMGDEWINMNPPLFAGVCGSPDHHTLIRHRDLG